MTDKPLYYGSNFNKPINPVKILPSLLEKHELKKKAQANKNRKYDEGILLGRELPKQKKIKKDDSQKFYRTKMCPKGRDCKNRFTCRFAHTQQQLRKPFMKRKNPCLLYQRGMCSLGSACRDYHGNIDLQKNYKYKQKICQNYLNGSCLKGNVCIHIHQMPQQQLEKLQQQQSYQDIEKSIKQAPLINNEEVQQKQKQKNEQIQQKQREQQNNKQEDVLDINDVVISFN